MRWMLGGILVAVAISGPARGDEPKVQFLRRTFLSFQEAEVTGEVARPWRPT
jgi:hypothetical protein